MTPNEYLILSSRTAKSFKEGKLLNEEEMDLLHAAIGMVTESGEFIDELKKHIYYNKPLDKVNLKEELGDLLWYVALAMRSLNISFEEIMNGNIKKLEIRYPNGVSDFRALNSIIKDEREFLDDFFVNS